MTPGRGSLCVEPERLALATSQHTHTRLLVTTDSCSSSEDPQSRGVFANLVRCLKQNEFSMTLFGLKRHRRPHGYLYTYMRI